VSWLAHQRAALGRRGAVRGVVVLGMHRSGTSAATRLVNLLGPATCDVNDMVRGPWNPRGHWESRSLMHLNDRILREMGRAWWYPPPDGDQYFAVTAGVATTPAEARTVFRKVHRSVPWVWKDPRTTVLLPFWRQALGPRLAAVIVYRNPMDVATSLQRRHDLPVSFGVALWERYNRLLLAHAGGMPAFVTRYDDIVADPARWTREVRSFLSDLRTRVGPVPGAELLAGTVDPQLRHSAHHEANLTLHPGARAVFETLEAHAGIHRSFVAPVLSAEDPAVERELAGVGPDNEPAWRPPPWHTRPAKGRDRHS
jgi:hypothetical protein